VTVGCRVVEIADDGADDAARAAGRGAVRTVVLYPADAPERPERVGLYVMDVALDAPPAEGAFPLVVVSHGTGGSGLVYRTLAAHLARRGLVVLLPDHPGNNRDDDALAGTHTILADRPRQVRRAIDWAYADAALGTRLVPDAVAVIGHSLGGYTALAVAGGRPVAGPRETPDGAPRPVPVEPDPRVKALVLLAPATPWLMAPGALADVRVPILMLTAERDPHTPAWHGDVVARGVPDASRLERRVVPNAGHFAFLSPFPPERTSPTFPPSQDPPGFDRPRFHEELNAEVLAFLRRALCPLTP
jgi:predicted dienelactone hydrolase